MPKARETERKDAEKATSININSNLAHISKRQVVDAKLNGLLLFVHLSKVQFRRHRQQRNKIRNNYQSRC